jgi:hypothetical protein
MEAMLGISLYSYLYLQLAKLLCLSYYLNVFSSTKLEKRAEQSLPGSEVGRGGEGGGQMGRGAGLRDGTSNVYTYKSINNKKTTNNKK